MLREGESVLSLASRFGVSMDDIETVNGIRNLDSVNVGDLYFIPLNLGLFCFHLLSIFCLIHVYFMLCN